MIPAAWRASLGYLQRHPWQLVLALLGVAVGVAVIVAVDLTNSSARKAFLLSMDRIAGAATHQVIGGPEGVPESLYTALRVAHGIRAIAPVVEGEIEADGLDIRLLGVDPFAERAMRAFSSNATPGAGADAGELVRGLLTEPGGALLSSGTAAALGIVQGDTFPVVADGQPQRASLVGTFAGDEGGGLDDLVVVDIATAQDWLNRSGWLSRIDVRIEPGEPGMLEELEAALPASTRLLDAAARSQGMLEMSRGFMTNLTAMSLLALLVGIFLILNSVGFSVLQRRDLIGNIRALGVTRGEVMRMILSEAAVIGLVAAITGVLLGIVLGEQLLRLVSRSINDLYFRVSVTDVDVDVLTVVKGLAAGLGAALLAALVPAREAASYQPRLAMSRSVLEQKAQRALPLVTAVGAATILLAVLLLALSGRNLVAGLVAVFMLILGFSLCAPLFVRYAAELLAPAAGRLAGTPARMAVAGIAASLSRTGVAVVALAVAVSATIGVTVMVDSFRASVADWLTTSLQADLYADTRRGEIDDALVRRLEATDGVADISTNRQVWLESESGRTRLIAIRTAPGSYGGTELLDARPETVWPAWEAGEAVFVSEPYAYHNGVARGDVVTLPTDRGPVELPIAATFRSYDVNASAVMLSRDAYDRYFDDDGIDSLGFYLTPDADAARTAEALAAAGGDTVALRVISNAEIRELSLEVFDQTFVITDVLYWLAMGVAFIGILSAMLALQLERAREFATLRALGMTPGQVAAMVTGQTGMLGLLSGIAAIPLGLVMAWVLIVVINRRAFGWQIDMSVSPTIVAASVAFAVAAALLAGIYPAIRAARRDPAIAMREE